MKKISIKTFYLIAVISIGLIGLAVGSTYAMFTTSAEINNPITISSNLTSNNDVMETFEVEIEPYKTVTQTININSGTVSNVNYAVWYLNNISNVDIGILSTNTRTTGVIKDAGSGTGCNIVLRNNSAEKKTITIGVATSKNNIVLASNMIRVPQTVIGERQINTNAATYIKKLYSTTEKSTVINNSITYNTSQSQLLMNDRKGSSSTGIDAGNIRYYGTNPDNYVYFNCSNYNNPTASTCELWRIIGVFDGKVKIMRSENIGAYSWDTTASTINGGVAYGQGTRGGMNILPTLYLNPDTIITKGEGTKDKPYKIKTNNLAARITSLYESSSKTSVTNGSKTYQYDTTNSLMKDAAGHIRYYGASPNNYIYFNCSNYSSQTSTTCEKWRIIGYVDNKVKLIRGSQIGTFSWDNKNDSTGGTLTYGKNDWTTARIMRLLNPSTYYTTDSNDNGYGQSLYWNAKSGTCFFGANNATKSCDFTSIGIKNTTTRNLISETKYYLGGSNTFSIYSNQMYDYERGKAVFTGRPTEWTGKVGLAYPSDYGYAADFRSCTQDLDNYNNSACTSKNWMKAIIAPNYGALINPHSGVSYSIWRINQNGGVGYDIASTDYGITPVIYLDPKLVIKSGTGTSSSPYQLSV